MMNARRGPAAKSISRSFWCPHAGAIDSPRVRRSHFRIEIAIPRKVDSPLDRDDLATRNSSIYLQKRSELEAPRALHAECIECIEDEEGRGEGKASFTPRYHGRANNPAELKSERLTKAPTEAARCSPVFCNTRCIRIAQLFAAARSRT